LSMFNILIKYKPQDNQLDKVGVLEVLRIQQGSH
jgi:hypothetical protein